MNKRELINFLHDELGFVYASIGRLYSVSRQRIHQIASNPKWTGIIGRPKKEDESNYLGFTKEEYLDLRHNACDDTIG